MDAKCLVLLGIATLVGCGDNVDSRLPSPKEQLAQVLTAQDRGCRENCSVGDRVLVGDAVVSDQIDIDRLSSFREITGSLIVSTTRLRNIDALANLERVGGNLQIVDNYGLENVDGLRSLVTVGGNLEIDHNSANSQTTPDPSSGLRSLRGVNAVRSVGGFLLVRGNHALTDLGLADLRTVGHSDANSRNVQVSFNASLSSCEVDSLVDQLMAAGYDGLFFVGSNPGRCE